MMHLSNWLRISLSYSYLITQWLSALRGFRTLVLHWYYLILYLVDWLFKTQHPKTEVWEFYIMLVFLPSLIICFVIRMLEIMGCRIVDIYSYDKPVSELVSQKTYRIEVNTVNVKIFDLQWVVSSEKYFFVHDLFRPMGVVTKTCAFAQIFNGTCKLIFKRRTKLSTDRKFLCFYVYDTCTQIIMMLVQWNLC